MRTSTFRGALVLMLLAAIALQVGATAATASTPSSRLAIADPDDDAASHSGAPTPAYPAAEIVEAVAEHATDHLILSLRFKGPSDPLTDPDIDNDRSTVNWTLRTESGSFAARSYVEDGEHRARVIVNDAPTCNATVAYDGALYIQRITVPRSCLGHPATVEFSVSAQYFLKPNPMDLYARFYDSVPAYGVFSPTVERARIATKLSSSVSTSTLTYGASATVSGTLARTANGKAIAGQKVALYRRYPGGSYSKVATAAAFAPFDP
jgi:hypothetical protein